jgi:nucleoside 2-deoxyribosyltransferase
VVPVRVYIAAPFFNDEQKLHVKQIEELLATKYYQFYSPMTHGGILEKGAPDQKCNKVFIENIGAIKWADVVVAVVDDFDRGTIWEMGYACALDKKVIAITFVEGRGMNVMLKEGITVFVCGIEKLRDAFEGDRMMYKDKPFASNE